ncbi:hypothetical protein [Isoalcanivorax indicus]|uniref:hypothetical protein n=1 Tax=Isoalcanivorax indicus TaxID=2202653 RepID=UPI0013C4C67E|nr:hypothetical protein [Isoalcanivorax indicus]
MKCKVIILVLFVYLGGCSVNPIVHNPDMLPESELARVSTEDIGRWLSGDQLFTNFMNVRDAEGKEIAAVSFMTSLPSTFVLSEGEYLFNVKCSNTNGIGDGVYSFSQIYVGIEAGEEYIVYCLSRSEKNFLGISMIRQMVAFISKSENYEKERADNVVHLKELKTED